MIKRTNYLDKIRPFINTDVIKVLTGVRRSGKSVMLELLKEEIISTGVSPSQCITLNFESLSNAHLCQADVLYKEIASRIQQKSDTFYLFFDEIQEVTHWEKCINSLRVDFNCDIYITGSNAHLLSGELATYLGGRYVEFTIYPFSFREYLESRHQQTPDLTEPIAFQNYLVTGGMPFLSQLSYDTTSITQYLRDIYNSVILKDVVQRNKIRDIDLLERIISYVMANIGHTFSARSIANYLKSEQRKVAPETVLNYIQACCNAYLLYQVKREDIVGKKILSINEKYYLVDHGIREAVYGKNTRDIDQLLENIVYMELLRRGYSISVGKLNNKEIDFIATCNNSKLYVQVAYLLASAETISREFDVYNTIQDNYPKYVVSLDEFDMSRNGIKHKNIRDFLLMKEWK